MTGNAHMDARIMENEARIRENVRQYRDRKAISSNKRIPTYGKTNGHWLKGLHHVLLLIMGRL
jgi:hypothetical protein